MNYASNDPASAEVRAIQRAGFAVEPPSLLGAIITVTAGDDRAETAEEAEAAETAALQRLIDAGAWGLEGSVGRAMMAAIEDGRCMLGPEGHRDYWGNYIPSRFEVEPGTKGSPEFAGQPRD